ncbi:MAG: M23 family metallopeptidase, partial [Chloroflexi bacterium]|nr:M23 family metallopeptidase [Chloroflexota bacterium]
MLRRIPLYFYLYLSLILIPVFLSGNRALPASPADISNWKLPLPPGEYQITQGDADDPMCSSHCNRSDPWLGCAIDIAASDGTLVLAPASGTVLFSSPDRGDGAGNYITIQHDNGLVTQYQHLKTRFVVEKDRVTQGQPIGRVDSTGRSNGPHLHFGIFTDSTYAQCVKITELDGNTSFRKNDRIISHNAQQGNAPEDVPSVPVTPHPTVSSQSVTPPASSDLADPVIENFLRSQNSPLTDYVPVFIAAGRYYNVDPRFVVAISNAESSLGKNGRCATERHNAWGYGGGWPSCWNFSGWSDAIWQVTSDIGKFYFERYHQTNIPSFVISPAGTCQSHCWCASGCTNWIKLVGDAYETMGGDRNTNDLSFSAYSNSSPITPVPSPAGQPILVSPANGSSWPQSTEITLVWNAVSNATQYKVELWGGPYDRMTPCNWQNATSCRIGTMWPGTMYWRVKARNASGQESEWSETWSFTIQEVQPTAPP